MKLMQYTLPGFDAKIIRVQSSNKKRYLLIGEEEAVKEMINTLVEERDPEYIGVFIPICLRRTKSNTPPFAHFKGMLTALGVEFQLFDSAQNPSGTFDSGCTFSYVNGIWQLEKDGQLFLVVSETREVVSEKRPRYLALFLPETTPRQDMMRYVCQVRPVDKTLLTLV